MSEGEYKDHEEMAMKLFERFVVAVERAVEIADRQSNEQPISNGDEPAIVGNDDEPAPSRRKVIDIPKVRDAGSAHGVSNLLFFAIGPKIVRLLLRDERAIAHGLLASSIDEGVGCTPERRTRVLNRLVAELDLVTIHSAKRGQPATVKITDVELAKMWLAEVEGSG